MIHSAFWTNAPPERAFDIVASIDAMKLFRGNALVPGISDVIPRGRELLVRDSWGFWNRECVVLAARPSRLVFHISPNPLLRFLIGDLLEEWDFSESYGGTLVYRSFSPSKHLPFCKNVLYPAIKKNNEDLRQLLSRKCPPSQPLSIDGKLSTAAHLQT